MANETVFKRYEKNPIIIPDGIKNCNSICNSAIIRYGQGYTGVFRVITQEGFNELRTGNSPDGLRWEIDSQMMDIEWPDEELAGGKRGYDPRITKLEDSYYVTFCHSSYHGAAVGLLKTNDFKKFIHVGNPFPPYNRNAVLFPRKINGKYAMLHRPASAGHTPDGSVFYSTSPDLTHWGKHYFVFGPGGGCWQGLKVGPGTVPVEIPEGWLLIYHGVLKTCSGFVYSAGGVILDKEEPWKVLYRTKRYLLAPTAEYERTGDVPNVVFPTSLIINEDSGKCELYYGCADTAIGVAYAQLDELVEFIKKNSL